MKKTVFIILIAIFCAAAPCLPAAAKTDAAGQTVDMTLFYIANSAGEDVLAAHVGVAEMEADLRAGRIDGTNHNYSVLDNYVTTVHQEARGFTIPEFVAYAQSKSGLPAIRGLELTFAGADEISLWEIDQTGYDALDTYTYDALYGAARYNFPLLYEYWDYRAQDYRDPAGEMSRAEVVDHILAHGEPEQALLAVRAFSQRYFATGGKYDAGDFDMEDAWLAAGLQDNARALRFMKPMTERELRDMARTASDSRYWVCCVRLGMKNAPEIAALGTVAAPAAAMTEDDEYYYIRFSCATEGATILYNHNYLSPSYTPTRVYEGGAVAVPKSAFPNGAVTMTCRAVKDGWADAGVVTLALEPSGREQAWQSPFLDVSAGDWYHDAVGYVVENGLFAGMGGGYFNPEETMTRAMFATVLHRYAGLPAAPEGSGFSDVTENAWYAPAVAWASAAGAMNGIGDGLFGPAGDITLEQMLTVLYRYTGALPGRAAPTTYGEISEYAAEAVAWAADAGLLSGVGGTLTAKAPAERAQVAAIFANLNELTERGDIQ